MCQELRKQGAIVEFVEPPIHELGKFSTSYIAEKLISVEYAKYGQMVRKYEGGKYEKFAVPFLMKMCSKGSRVSGQELHETVVAADVLKSIMRKFMNEYDLLLMPSTPIPPRDNLSYLEEGYMVDRIDGKRKTIGQCHHSIATELEWLTLKT